MTTPNCKEHVAVVGAGLGGLSAAVSLATQGFEVDVFEKNDKIGGKLNVLEKDGFKFDLGPSIIILPHLFRRLWENVGREMEDYLVFEELQPQWRSFYEDGVVLDLHSDMRLMERELEKLGADAAGYWAYIEASRKLWKFAEEAFLERGADTIREIMRGFSVREAWQGTTPHQTMHQVVAKFVKEPHLRHMLDFFIKYVGSSAYDAPALMNLLPYSQLGYGLFYVRGGMYNLARGLGRLMEELGVRVHLGSEVTRIEKESKRVTGIVLADGKRVAADAVVSNMEVIPAYERLMGEDGLLMKRYRYMFEPAASGLVVHLGLDTTYPELEHHNFFFSRDPKGHFDAIHRRKEMPEDPTLYVVRPTRTDSTVAPEGHDIIKILPHIPYIQPEPHTAADYEALKERVIDKMERILRRSLRDHVIVEDVLTPVDLQRMYYSNKGAIYGVITDRRRNFALKAPKQSEKYENLFFVGGSVNPGGGTPMVVLCGQHVAQRVASYFG